MRSPNLAAQRRAHFAATAVLLALHAVACTSDAPDSSPLGMGGVAAGANEGGVGGVSAAAGGMEAGAAATGGAGGMLAGGQGGTLAGAGAGGDSAGGSSGAQAGDGAGDGAAGMSSLAAASAIALTELAAYLETPRLERAQPVVEQAFASVPLTRANAEQASALLWEDYAAWVRQTRASEVGATTNTAARIEVAGSALRYYLARRGSEPMGGRSLFISMHGGGNAPAATNDSQWQNQIALVDGYDPRDAVWIAPRAPIDDWNMWFVPEIEPLFDRLITNMIVFEGIDPNKVYLTGYSAGGDGAYQLGPRMADRWAGVVMSAGHPNDASPVNLRNVAFAIHVGGNDTAYERNLKAAEWGQMLEALAASDGDGYRHQWQVHAGRPHWLSLADAVAIPFVQAVRREPAPNKVVWRQANVTQSRFYWLAVVPAEERMGTTVTASYAGDTITLSEISGLMALTVRASDVMLDLDQPVQIERGGQPLFSGMLTRTIATIAQTLDERGDPAMVYSAQLAVQLE